MITGKFPNLRLRRSRKYDWSRRLVQENNLSTNDLILPIFLIDGKNRQQAIKSMPDVYRYTIDKLGKIVNNAIENKIPMIALFPSTSSSKKNDLGTEALNEDNLVCRAIRFIKKKFRNDIGIMCDVALDPYTSHGHDGLLKSGYVINDETVDMLVKQSLLQAEMGCNVIAPSDMMDGRIGRIRKALDKNGNEMVQILSYAVKYASNFYGPFRDAVNSKNSLTGDKKNYQMDFNNTSEALREVAGDYGKVYGEDYVILGYRPGSEAVIKGMVRDLRAIFSTDVKNTKVEEIPMMEGVYKFEDFDFLFSASAGFPGSLEWMQYATDNTDVKMSTGTTSIMVNDIMPFVVSDQIQGILAGMPGAAEYEKLVGKKGVGTSGMDAQSFAHLVIVFFIVFGNIGYFIERKKNRKY